MHNLPTMPVFVVFVGWLSLVLKPAQLKPSQRFACPRATTLLRWLRWHVQRGDIVFPKSTTPERIEENFQIFDFELEPEDIAAISALDRGEEGRTGPNPDVFAFVPR